MVAYIFVWTTGNYEQTKPDTHPLPWMEDTLDCLHDAQ